MQFPRRITRGGVVPWTHFSLIPLMVLRLSPPLKWALGLGLQGLHNKVYAFAPEHELPYYVLKARLGILSYQTLVSLLSFPDLLSQTILTCWARPFWNVLWMIVAMKGVPKETVSPKRDLFRNTAKWTKLVLKCRLLWRGKYTWQRFS